MIYSLFQHQASISLNAPKVPFSFKAQYSFKVESLPDGAVFAAIEIAENLDAVRINGTAVTPLKEKGTFGAFDPAVSWKDAHFTKVPLTGHLKKGVNVIELEGIKVNNIVMTGMHEKVSDPSSHFPTEIETIYLIGNFNVSDINREEFFIDGNAKPQLLPDLTDHGFPFYAGKLSLKTTVSGDFSGKTAFLKLGDPNVACAEVLVNGKRVGAKGFEPYLFDLTGFLAAGDNQVEVVISTTLFNVMGPNRVEGIEQIQYVSPWTFLDSHTTDQYYLRKFGMKNAMLIIK